MAAFPTLSRFSYIIPLEMNLVSGKTLISSFDEYGEEKRRKKQTFVKRDLALVFENLLEDDIRLLWRFHVARHGSYEAFNIFLDTNFGAWISTDSYIDEYVGVGNDSTVLFNLPAKSSSDYKVYVQNPGESSAVEKTGGGVDYTFSALGGTDGADEITFTTAPEAGAIVTYDFTGTLKIRSRFKEDEMTYQQFYDRLFNAGLETKGLLNS